MRNYTTQMDAARKGILTPEIETVAKKEHMPVEKMMQLVAEGKVAICANKNHTCLDPEGVGSMLRLSDCQSFHHFIYHFMFGRTLGTMHLGTVPASLSESSGRCSLTK